AQVHPTTAQAFYSTTMPTHQTEELTKQRYPNIRVPRSIDNWINETNEINHNFDVEIDINDSGNDYLIDFLMDEIRLEDFNEEVNHSRLCL
ncbi:12488_t:CDS:2, partial [Funneliformis mosseae]